MNRAPISFLKDLFGAHQILIASTFFSYRLETVSQTPSKNSMTEIQTGMEMFYDKYMIVSDGILP